MRDLLLRKTYLAINPNGQVEIKAYSVESAKRKLRKLIVNALTIKQGRLFYAMINPEILESEIEAFEIMEKP